MNLDKNKCLGCGQCVEMCNTGALDYVMINGKSYNDVTLDKALCVDCGECIEICPGEAFEK